ncbi:MAG: bifunctional oligoribonuclease/PAP phosphatase NrnA [Phycisphaerae bacterium]|nr:bifunctional oligoribonuclease/PAP phosphatase NrnA [Phycisphaerae bacterium]
MIESSQLQRARDLVVQARRILVATHTKPDGDGCGCVAAMTEALQGLGKEVCPLFLSPVPTWYQFLSPPQAWLMGRDLTEEDLIRGRVRPFDLIVLLDVSSRGQLPGLQGYLEAVRTPVLVIDHHPISDGLGDVEMIDPSAVAAGVLVFDLLRFARWPLTPSIAEALFVAAATDTGWFQFVNTDSRVYRVCADLVDAGAGPAALYARLYQDFAVSRFRLMVAMLNSLELHFDGRFALQVIRRSDFERTGGAYQDTENLIHECHRIGTVQASALLVETEEGPIRCSLRSRASRQPGRGEAVDVSRIAAKFGGGGHKMAAGAFLQGPIEQAAVRIRAEFAPYFPKG